MLFRSVAGDKVSIDDVLVIQVGNGKRSVDDSIDVVDPVYHGEEEFSVMLSMYLCSLEMPSAMTVNVFPSAR